MLSGGEPGGELRITPDGVQRRLAESAWRPVEPALRRIASLEGELGVVAWHEENAADGWLTLSHPRLRVISYPHEWCGEMLHDAALLHARLLAAVSAEGLWLKDAHPWNVLFEGTRARFVDVSSFLPRAALSGLDYLQGARDRAFEVFRLMFPPYFLEPLAFHRAGLGDAARSVLWRFPLNAAPRYPRVLDYFAHLPPRRLPRALGAALAARQARARLHGVAAELPSRLEALVQSLTPPVPESAYSSYYAQKGEAQALDRPQQWNPKQRHAVAALDAPDVESVLDLGCNTGWYSRALARRGKRVTAVDADGACISLLYREARAAGEDVTPLVLDVLRPTPDRERTGGGLLMIGAGRRLKSDAVLALGLLHHLVLGAGEPLPAALARLSALAHKRLVVEFIGADDEKVRGEPSFFAAYSRRPGDFGQFTLKHAKDILTGSGWQVAELPSHPPNRALLVCSRA